MFRKMRRIGQQLCESDCLDILTKGTSGVLALCGDEGYPYTVPLNYIFLGGKIYFHGAAEGHKIDSINRCDKVSFCVIAQEQNLPEILTTAYTSVVVFGRARLLTNPSEKRDVLIALAAKFAPQHMDKAHAEIGESLARTGIIEITIEHMTGKTAIENLAAKKGAGN